MVVNGFPRGVKIYTDQVSGISAVTNSAAQITVSWTNPTSKKFIGVMIRYKAGSYPSTPTDGVQAYLGTGTSIAVSGLAGGTTYYFRAFAKATNTSGTKVYYNTNTTGAQVTKATKIAAGQVVFTSSQIWTIPEGVNIVDAFGIGGGAAGGSAGDWSGASGGAMGGCSGKTVTNKNIAVTPGGQVSIVIGAGGVALDPYVKNNWYGIPGGITSAIGAGINMSTPEVNSITLIGGSGAGGGAVNPGSYGAWEVNGGNGGSDGSAGANANGWTTPSSCVGTIGQGTTTRAFSESDKTLYGGGGGGAADKNQTNTNKFYGGTGGNGGGGNGASVGYYWHVVPTAATPNTGSGGGAGSQASASYSSVPQKGCNGGSGLFIIRWPEQ